MRKITLREIEVLRYMANGFTMCEIAVELYISVETVITHKKNLITKFEARNTTHLIFLATKEGLIGN